ncbi:MAG: archease [Thermoplasmata archaeon]|nr:archease [Thermoplasmata archaeon]MCI4354294.1 archease [Thermoplasmata archaeon]
MPVASRPTRSWGRFPTTADMGIRATGATASELYEALGLGLFALITDLRKVRPTEERAVAASADDPESLVVAFLGQLLLLQQTEGFLVRSIHARAIGSPPTSILASARGESYDPARHPQRIEVKAITLHRLVFDPARGRARVIVDI